MHATGHALLAAAAGVLARALAGHVPMDGRSTPVSGIAPISMGGTPIRAVVLLSLCGVFAALIKLVGGALSSWAEARVSGEVGATVRLAVLDRVLSASGGVESVNEVHALGHGDHGSPKSATDAAHVTRGARLAALTTHIHDIERGVAHGVLAEIRAIVQLVPLFVLLVLLAPRLAGSAVVALGAFGVLAFVLRRAFKRAHARATASTSALVDAADEAVRHAELWATYGAKRRIRSHVAGIGRVLARESASVRVRASVMSSTSEVLGALALLLVLVLASRGALGVDHSVVVPFAIAFFMAYKPLRELVDARIARARGEAALQVALPTSSEPKRFPSDVRVETTRRWALEALRIEGVRSLHGKHDALSVDVPPGTIAAVVGPTGIGKTSLLRALLGLEPSRAGVVHYGAHPLGAAAGVGPNERPFAWVPQDAPVIGDTLAINVALGRADDDFPVPDPRPILAELGAEDLAATLGDDILATKRPLSGGERQWIAIARALATGLPVLLLDEPTSALDGPAQARLLEAIAKLRGKRTVLLVTHRPEPLAIADMVVRLAQPQPQPQPQPREDNSRQGGVSTSRGGPAVTSRMSARKSSPSST
jgi:ABC-type multidrug transport system fused ATPase/permease subunit